MRFAGQHNHCLEGLRKHLVLPGSLPRLVRGHGEQLHCRGTLSGYALFTANRLALPSPRYLVVPCLGLPRVNSNFGILSNIGILAAASGQCVGVQRMDCTVRAMTWKFHSCRFTDKVITPSLWKSGVITFLPVIYHFFTARTSSQGDSSKELYFIMYMMVFTGTGVTCRGSISPVVSTHVVWL